MADRDRIEQIFAAARVTADAYNKDRADTETEYAASKVGPIARKYLPNITDGGMSGGIQSFADIFSPEASIRAACGSYYGALRSLRMFGAADPAAVRANLDAAAGHLIAARTKTQDMDQFRDIITIEAECKAIERELMDALIAGAAA